MEIIMKNIRTLLMTGILVAGTAPAQAGTTVAVAPNVTMSSPSSKPVLQGLSSAANGVQRSVQSTSAYKNAASAAKSKTTAATPDPYAGKKIIYPNRTGAPVPRRNFNVD